jgi:hypothetical protein
MDKAIAIKTQILEKLRQKLEQNYNEAMQIVSTTKSLVQSNEFKAESKWDTRAIEAGYLASAQSKRLKEIELELKQLENLHSLIEKASGVQAGSLLEWEDKWYFFTIATGGIKLLIEGRSIQVLSLHSPLAQKIKEDFD